VPLVQDEYAAAPEMKRSTFVIFGLVVLILGVGIPAWAITTEGTESAAPEEVASNLESGKELFVTNCGACHTLFKAGTDGVIGPDLDELLAPPSASAPDPATIKPRVLSAVNNGVGGRMPRGVVSGQQAEEVATFVAQVAGQTP
jgi:mono/diheme cytochrome c family protein